jgi:hypothetical protein
MIRFRVTIIYTLLACLFLHTQVAQAAAQKTVHVKGYTKKDGTYVAPYDRKAPSSSSTPKTETPKAETPKTTPAKSTSSSTNTKATDAERLKQAEDYLHRSEAARRAFMKQTGYPNGRPGYIVDHIIPLACHGADAPSNMQWQTVAEAKAKDKYERAGCH